MDPGFVELIFQWGKTNHHSHSSQRKNVGCGRWHRRLGHGPVRDYEGAFELFGKVHKGFPEDRTGYRICMVQCNMQMQGLFFQIKTFVTITAEH